MLDPLAESPLELTTPAPAPVLEPALALVEAAAEPEAEPAPQPVMQPILAFEAATVAAEQDEEPLMASQHYADQRRPKSNFLTLFGGPRNQRSARPSLAPRGGALPVEAADEPEVEDNSELEIPSFLRRLAN